MNYEYVKEQIERIQKSIQGKGIKSYKDYTIFHHIFSQKYSEDFFKGTYNVHFCNGLKHPINKIQLVYSAYEGVLSIVPVGDHESYFNVTEDFETEKWNKAIFDLWQKLILL
jgi:hypothetical protein